MCKNLNDFELAKIEQMLQRHMGVMSESFQHKLDQHKEELKEEFRHQLGIQAESFQHKLDIVIEGVQMLAGRMDRMEARLDKKIECLEHKLDAVAADLAAHRADTEAHPNVYRVRE